jgi:hypothetical protein
MHEWPGGRGKPGAVCSRPGCGHRFGQRGRQANPGGVIPSAAAVDEVAAAPVVPITQKRQPSSALRERWNLSQELPGNGSAPEALGAAAGAASESSSAAPKASESAKKLATMWAPWIADGAIAFERWIIERRGYIPREPAEEPRAELHECVGEILQRLLPDVTVGPWARAGISLPVLYASMRVGAEKKPDALPPKVPEKDASGFAPPDAGGKGGAEDSRQSSPHPGNVIQLSSRQETSFGDGSAGNASIADKPL